MPSPPASESPADGALPADASDLDAHVRHADPDRWLAARLVDDPGARASLLALYALDDEFARVAASVTQPMLGEMRLAWWSEAVEEAAQGRPRGHPVLQAAAPALASGAVGLSDVQEIIEARALDFEPRPFADEAALTAWIDATSGALMRAAARLLDRAAPAEATRAAARAWGWTGLVRADAAWRARGRLWTPRDWGEVAPEVAAERARAAARAALDAARHELKALPVGSFPAVAYVRFARDYLRGRTPGELARRAQLLWASTVGRV